MFTKITLKGLETYFKIHNLIKAGPFYWKQQSNGSVLQIHTSKVHWLFIAIVTSWIYIRTTFSGLNFVLRLLDGNEPIVSSAINYLYLQFFVVNIGYHLNMLQHMNQMKQFGNNLLNFNHRTAVEVFGSAFPVKSDGCEKLIWMLLSMSCNSTLFTVYALFIYDPMNGRYLYRFLSDGTPKGVLYWTWPLTEYISDFIFWSPWLLVFFLMWAYAKSTVFWLQQIRYGSNRHFTERPKDVIKIFQQLHILNLQFNSCFAELGMPVLICQNLTAHVSMIYSTLRFHDSFPPLIYPILPLWAIAWFYIEGVMYTMLGNVNHYSKSFVKSWTDVVGKNSRKKLKSMPPLGVNIGSVYTIHRTTVLSIFLVIVNLSVQVLLVY